METLSQRRRFQLLEPRTASLIVKTPSKIFRFTVKPPEAGERLDVFLAKQLTSESRSQIKTLIQSGHAKVGGKLAKPAQLLREGDELSLEIPELKSLELSAQRIPLDILYEDRHLLVLNKDAERVVHPGAGIREGTLVNALLYHCQDLSGIGGVARPGIVHRLDKGTSGVLVVAKDDVTHRSLVRQFKDRAVEKRYLAFVWGRLRNLRGSIELPLGRSHGDRKKISSRSGRRRDALTHYQVLKQWEQVALLELSPQTGRTHQIRVHLAETGHPVLGDPVYGKGQRRLEALPKALRNWVERRGFQLLHAASLSFQHPITQKRMQFKAPMREEMRDLQTFLEKGAE